jgi:hypothetical protein
MFIIIKTSYSTYKNCQKIYKIIKKFLAISHNVARLMRSARIRRATVNSETGISHKQLLREVLRSEAEATRSVTGADKRATLRKRNSSRALAKRATFCVTFQRMRCFCDQREQKYGRGASRAPNRIRCVICPDDRREESAAGRD